MNQWAEHLRARMGLAITRNQAKAEPVLLSGDEDLGVAVQPAQEYGVRVHLP